MLTKFLDNPWYRALGIVLFWTVWMFIRLGEFWSTATDDIDWSQMFLRQFFVAFGWAVTTPFMLWVTTRLRKAVNVWLAIGLHLVSSAVVLTFRAALHAVVISIINQYSNVNYQQDIGKAFINFWLAWGYGAFLLYGFIVAGYSALLWFKEYKESEQERYNLKAKSETLERQLTDAKLTALRMQLNPHFLFNTLHSVATLVRLADRERAISMLAQLSGMLRYTVDEGTRNMVTAREEVEFIKGYLGIEETRFQDRLKVNWNIEEESLNGLIPSLLLQPIVENSIKHGLKQTDDGVLTIEMKRVENTLSIQIQDNGVGLPDNWKLEESKGIGLRNTLARLQTVYPNNFRFDVVNNGNQQGTWVGIVLPFVNRNGHG